MKRTLSILIAVVFTITPIISSGYYQSCSSLYGYGAIDAGNGYCKCMSGYARYGNKCISLYSYCQKLYGYNATYDSLHNSCKCNYGYGFYGGTCQSYDTICQKEYGYDYHYNSLNGYCEVKKFSTNVITNNKNNCNIKGNISYNGGEKIYHVPGCPNYNQTIIDTSKGERWFCSEAEARAAGWRKAKNCP